MELNRSILTNKVSNKLTKACLSAIVTETFMRALPLTSSEVVTEAAKYSAYTTRMINALHGESMLAAAMEANQENPDALKLLNRIDQMIKSVVNPATNRIVTEAAKNTSATLDEIVDKAAFTPEEMKTFMAKGKELDLETVSGVIRDKVVSTIKTEKDAYDASQKMRQDIRDTLAETVGQSAPSTEAWIDSQLSKNDPRQYISLYSRIQDVCLEFFLSNESTEQLRDDENISLEAMTNITINHTLDCFDRTEQPITEAIESLTRACEGIEGDDAESAERLQCASKKSLIMAIIITTILETLKTMRLFSPDVATIRKFVDAPTSVDRNTSEIGDVIAAKVLNKIGYVKRLMKDPEYNKVELSEALDALGNLRTALDAVSESAMSKKPDVMKAIEETCTAVEMMLANESAGYTPQMNYFTTRCREQNVASFDKIYRILTRNPETAKIRICCESSMSKMTEKATVKAVAMDSANRELSQLAMDIDMVPAFESVLTEIRTAAKYSRCNESADMCELYFTDKCYSTPLIEG